MLTSREFLFIYLFIYCVRRRRTQVSICLSVCDESKGTCPRYRITYMSHEATCPRDMSRGLQSQGRPVIGLFTDLSQRHVASAHVTRGDGMCVTCRMNSAWIHATCRGVEFVPEPKPQMGIYTKTFEFSQTPSSVCLRLCINTASVRVCPAVSPVPLLLKFQTVVSFGGLSWICCEPRSKLHRLRTFSKSKNLFTFM